MMISQVARYSKRRMSRGVTAGSPFNSSSAFTLKQTEHRSFVSYLRITSMYQNKNEKNIPNLSLTSYRASISNFNDDVHSSRLGSVRFMGRRDGNKAFFKPRLPSKKKIKKRNRRMEKIMWEKEGKHSPHGSRMNAREEQVKTEIDMILDKAKGKINRYLPDDGDIHAGLEYNQADALVDDLLGNTSHLTSTPTPKPKKIGYHYHRNYRKVKEQMTLFHKQKQINIDNQSSATTAEIATSLPTDEELSQLIRSYRDRYGTRKKPVGIAKVLQLLLTNLRIPTSTFRAKTYTSIMTCAAHPKEALRIMKLMEENGQPLTQHAYSILVDIYAKKGDFRAARKTIDQMSEENITPTLPAYTSLLAACYQIVNRANAPHKLKAEAGLLGWESWKEMRIIGIEADVMAYGSIIRLCAARGRPERCLNLIDEMHAFGVLPTTLIFTAALRSVAKSHENALRFEGGYSKKNKRREEITAYHGRLTREIVIKAEAAEVEQDDGFIAALMLCTAAAGDSATAKAILLASEVRKLTNLRTIGSNDHLLALTGGLESQLMISGNSDQSTLPTFNYNNQNNQLSPSDLRKLRQKKLDEREYGKDLRIHSALMLSYANAMKKKGLGILWAGIENKGYLCEQSLKLITTRREPLYRDNSIPGLSPLQAGLSSMTWEEEDPDPKSKQLRREKFKGINQDPNIGNTLDDLDPGILRMYDGIPDESEIDPDGYNFSKQILSGFANELQSKGSLDFNNTDVLLDQSLDSNNFDENYDFTDSPLGENEEVFEYEHDEVSDDDGDTIELDQNSSEGMETTYSDEYLREYHNTMTDLLSKDFDTFYAELLNEIDESDEDLIPDEAEARNLYELMKDEKEAAAEAIENKDEEQIKEIAKGYEFLQSMDLQDIYAEGDDELNKKSAESFASELMEMSDEYNAEKMQGVTSFSTTDNLSNINNVSTMAPKLEEKIESSPFNNVWAKEVTGKKLNDPMIKMKEMEDDNNSINELSNIQSSILNELQEAQLEDQDFNSLSKNNKNVDELDLLLEGMPASRIKKVRQAFLGTLGDPSLLKLVPILRENVPPNITVNWLRKKNIKNAQNTITKLEEEGLVDIHMLNGLLQVQTHANNAKKAMLVHEEAEKKYGVTPNNYSDRLVVDMLVRQKKMEEAFAFKEKIESDGRTLDLLSYGLMIEHYANHEQLEPALELLKETIAVHRYPPGEKSLKKIRLMCRQQNIEKEVGLIEMIGKDPNEWFRHGEEHLKREYSKKGRMGVTETRNVATKI